MDSLYHKGVSQGYKVAASLLRRRAMAFILDDRAFQELTGDALMLEEAAAALELQENENDSEKINE